MTMIVDIRHAERADRIALRALQAASFRALGPACYDDDVIETFITHVGTMDDTLIDDGNYFVACVDGALVGCGGWSSRTPSYAAHMPGDAAHPPRRATVRSVYVHPAITRQGIARCIMGRIETDIRAAGYDHAWLGSTLVGVPFYRRLGYRGGEPAVLRMPGDLLFVELTMHKRLDAAAMSARGQARLQATDAPLPAGLPRRVTARRPVPA